MARSRKKKVLWAGVWLLAALALILVALPIWLPWVLRPLTAARGVRFANYERSGYARFVLTDVTFTNATTTFRARKISGLIPTVWLWEQHVSAAKTTYALAENWNLVVVKSKEKKVQPVTAGKGYEKASQAIDGLMRWLPRASLTNGVLDLNGERIHLPETLWDQGELYSRIGWPKYELEAQVRANLGRADQQQIQINSESLDLHSVITVLRKGAIIELQSTNRWLTNDIVAGARFTGDSWVPQQGEIEASRFKISGREVNLPAYETVEGMLTARWETNQFVVNLAAKGAAVKGSQMPPGNLEVQARGDLQGAVVEKANISTPWLQATLKPETPIQFASPYLSEATTLQWAVELAAQPWVGARGRLEGQAELRPGQGTVPEASFSVAGSGIQVSNIETKTVAIEGELVWPELRITDGRLQTLDGTALGVQGIADLANRMVHYGNISYAGSFAKRWLPKGYDFTNANVTATVSGAWTNLEHSGKFQIQGLKTPWAKPVDAAGNWKGEGARIDSIDLGLREGETALDAKVTLERAADAMELRVAGLDLRKSGKSLMQLEKPARISFGDGRTNIPHLNVPTLHWLGAGGDLRVEGEIAWPESGHVTAELGGMDLQVLSGFFSWATNQVTIGRLELGGGWSNGPVALRGKLQAKFNSGTPLSARTELSMDRRGIHIEALTITNGNQLVGSAAGDIPISFHPGSPKGLVQTDSTAPLQLKISAEPRAFSEYVRGAGVVVERPDLQIQLEGTMSAPRGQIELSAAGIQFARTNRNLPAIENVRLHATVERQSARVTGLQFTVAKQPVNATGEIPLGDHFWSGVTNKELLPDWKTARARVQVSHAQLAPFAPMLPKIVSPEGELDVDVSLVPGGKLDGHVTVSKARTYPIGSVGSLRDILVRLRFEGQKMLVEAAADLGGQPVPITGSADFSGGEWLKGVPPPFELSVGGAAVPLSRSPELILKADLDLRIFHEAGQPVTVGGSLNLRDGYYLRDLSQLAQGKTASPSQRPPYFSVSEEPMAGWLVKLNVTGTRFIKVRSPLFNGEISTVMHLQGTLKEPIVIGDVKIDSGEVRFPFATLPVTQGLVTLTSENPYHPQLSITAGARTFGYDIKMEITGSADAPVIQFNSTPPLSSEQILLMVSAGDLPRGELTFSSVQKAQRLALFIGKDLLSGLGFAGGANRLTIRSGEDISEAGKPTYSVEYKLAEDWSVIGEYDRFNDFNLMLKWRFYSK